MSVSRPKKNRLTKLAEARKRIEGKKKIVDPYRRTGGFGLSQGQKTKIALEKKKKRDAEIAKRKAQEAKVKRDQPKNLLQEEGPGQGTTPSRRELTEQRAAKSRPKIKKQAKELKTKAEDKSKFVEGGLRAAQKKAQENVGTAASLLIGGPALGLGIKAVSGGFKLGDKIYKTVNAARKAANKAKTKAKPQPKAKAEPKPKPKAKAEPKPKPKAKAEPKAKAKAKPKAKTTASGRGKVTESPGARAAAWVKSKFTPKPKPKPKPKAKTKAKTKKKPVVSKAAKAARDKRVAAIKTQAKKAAPYVATAATAGGLGYGLGKLQTQPGKKPTFEPKKTPKKTVSVDKTADIKGGRGKAQYVERPGQRVAATIKGKKDPINGIMDSPVKKPKEEIGSAMSGRPEGRAQRRDYEDFLKSRGGIKGFQRNLFGKDKTVAAASAKAKQMYDDEQRDRKRDPDKYEYGSGRRSLLNKRKGGKVGKAKGGMVRFSTGGRVLDTYDYN